MPFVSAGAPPRGVLSTERCFKATPDAIQLIYRVYFGCRCFKAPNHRRPQSALAQGGQNPHPWKIVDNFPFPPLPPHSVPAILRSMTPRTLTFVILTALVAFGSPLSAKDKKKSEKSSARTWKTLIDHVVKNGDEDPIQGSTARTLGYESDYVYAKSMGIDTEKSTDNREHGVYVVCDKNKSGALIPKEIVLGAISVKETGSEKVIDGFRVRMSLDGKVIRGMHATGVVGHVVHEILQKDSKTLLSVYKAESSLYLNKIDLAQLTK